MASFNNSGIRVAPRQKFYNPSPKMLSISKKQQEEEDAGFRFTEREKTIQQIPYATIVGNAKRQLDAMGKGNLKVWHGEGADTIRYTCEQATGMQEQIVANSLALDVLL